MNFNSLISFRNYSNMEYIPKVGITYMGIVFSDLIMIATNRCNLVINRCDVVLNRCDVVLNRCDVVLNRCDVVLIRCDVVLIRCDVVLNRCDVVLNRCDVVGKCNHQEINQSSIAFKPNYN